MKSFFSILKPTYTILVKLVKLHAYYCLDIYVLWRKTNVTVVLYLYNCCFGRFFPFLGVVVVEKPSFISHWPHNCLMLNPPPHRVFVVGW